MVQVTDKSDNFPFTISDIVGWVIKRKDGTVIKYNLVTSDDIKKRAVGLSIVKPGGYSQTWNAGGKKSSYSAWCDHEPHPDKKDPPIFAADGIALWIGDCIGARKVKSEFDVCIDGGNVLDVPGEHDLPILYGDPGLKSKLSRFLTVEPKTETSSLGPRILKIRWADRAIPPVKPEFWSALLTELRAERDRRKLTPADPLRVMTICMGGHGRSGTAAASLIMCLSDYTPLDALTHVRAMHCARAIESKAQHEYLNTLAASLGRSEDALEAEKVPSFKDRLLKMTSEFAKEAQGRLAADKSAGAVREEREGSYL